MGGVTRPVPRTALFENLARPIHNVSASFSRDLAVHGGLRVRRRPPDLDGYRTSSSRRHTAPTIIWNDRNGTFTKAPSPPSEDSYWYTARDR